MEKSLEEKNKEENSDEIAVYELGYHLAPETDDENISSEVSAIKSAIEKNGGNFIDEELPKKIQLAYDIVLSDAGKRQRFDSAYFGWVKFDMEPSKIGNLKAVLEENKNIIRFLIIKTVRESTLAPKKILLERIIVNTPVVPKKLIKPTEEEKNKGPISVEELDRTIEELVVE